MRLIALLLSFFAATAALAMDSKMTLDRSWGLLIGDRIQATVDLPVDSADLDIHSLPALDKRYGPWLILDGLTMHDKTLNLSFQLINVPAENRQVLTPEMTLRTKAGEFINLPTLPIQIGSFMQLKKGRAELVPKSDAILPRVGHAQLLSQLYWGLLVLVLSSLVWLGWHFGFRPRQRLPFATALFELNKMRLLGRKDKEAASRSLHHAFNRCAGRVVIHSQLDKLWQSTPWLEPLKVEIEGFYAQSAAHFFSPNAAEGRDFEQLLTLVKACRAKEKLA